MAEIVPYPNRLVTSQAPQSSVTGGEIASPFAMLAGALDKTGEALSDTAVPLAEQAGYSAVGRDAQGNVTVERLPIVGKAAEAYSRGVKIGAMAEGAGAARRADIKLRQQFPDDPEAYLKAADGLKTQLQQEYTKAAGPEVGASIAHYVDTTTTQTYRSMLNEKRHRDIGRAEDAINAQLKSLSDDINSLVETGAEGSPEFKQAVQGYRALLNEKVNNPMFGYPKEKADLELKNLNDQIHASAFLGGLRKTLDSGPDGVEKAQRAVEAAQSNTKLSPTQRALVGKYGAAEIKAYVSALEKQETLRKRQQKLADEAAEDMIIRDSASDKPVITDNDIKNADPKTISPESKMRMLAWRDRDGRPDPIARISQETSADLFRRMNLPEGDPNRLSSLGEIRDAYIQKKLSRTDEEWLEKRFKEDRSPEGSALNKDRDEFFKRYAATIDGAMDFGGHSALGSQKIFEFQKDAVRQENALRAAGKDPHVLYDPSSPQFIGRPEFVNKYRISLTEGMNYQKSLDEKKPNVNLTGPGKTITGTETLEIPDGMSPADAVKLARDKNASRVRLPDGRVMMVPR